MNYKAMSNMVLLRHIWRTIVKNEIFDKYDLPVALYTELRRRDWRANCFYCETHPDCANCPLRENLEHYLSLHVCVMPYYQWCNHFKIEGAKQILEVIEKDMK